MLRLDVGHRHGRKWARHVGDDVGQSHLQPLGVGGEATVTVPPDTLGASLGDAVGLEGRALTQGTLGLELLYDQHLPLLQAAVRKPAPVAPQGAHGAGGHVLMHEVVGRAVLDP